MAQVSLLSKLGCRRQSEVRKERAFGLYPLHQSSGAPSFAFFAKGGIFRSRSCEEIGLGTNTVTVTNMLMAIDCR